LENAFERIKNIDIINENVTHIPNFLEQLSAEGIGRPRQIKYLYTLGKLAKMLDKYLSKFSTKTTFVLGQFSIRQSAILLSSS